jgi:hypothetical protein
MAPSLYTACFLLSVQMLKRPFKSLVQIFILYKSPFKIARLFFWSQFKGAGAKP